MSIIAVDVDLTVVNTTDKWIEWLNRRSITKQNVSYLDMVVASYSESKQSMIPSFKYDIFKQFDLPLSINGLDYFTQEDLYDDQVPVMFAVDVLKKLSDIGHEIIFVSYCFTGHLDSKKRFLEKYFPFAKAFIATGDKKYVKADVIIDDRLSYIEDHDADMKLVIATPFLQTTETEQKFYSQLIDKKAINNYYLCQNWIDIAKLLL